MSESLDLDGVIEFPDGSLADARPVLEQFITSQRDLNALHTARNEMMMRGDSWLQYRRRVWYRPWTWFGSRWRSVKIRRWIT